MSEKDGGWAFPLPHMNAEDNFRGMTLRDYFAAQALAGVLSNLHAMDADIRSSSDSCERFARDVYRMADAMLVERAK